LPGRVSRQKRREKPSSEVPRQGWASDQTGPCSPGEIDLGFGISRTLSKGKKRPQRGVSIQRGDANFNKKGRPAPIPAFSKPAVWGKEGSHSTAAKREGGKDVSSKPAVDIEERACESQREVGSSSKE